MAEFIKYALIPLASIPYSAKIKKVMPINTALSVIISRVGEAESLETKSGKNAKKNIVNLGLSRLIAIAFITICVMLDPVLFLLISNVPASRHIFQAR